MSAELRIDDDFRWGRFTAWFMGAVLLVWSAVVLLVLATSGLDEDEQGTMLAAFAPGTPDVAVMTRVIEAGGSVVRQTALPSLWVVHGDDAGFVGRLRSNGALAAYRELPLDVPLAGCTGVILAREAD
ncbi:MAG: hypothetical protein KDE35_09000 [Geminicoccaceae bacterium]|nr:hypothetical protein [Geminicoccaceae bacterium]